jgi:hypothetical protein
MRAGGGLVSPRSALAALALLLALPGCAAAAGAATSSATPWRDTRPSLCTPNEVAIFSCATKAGGKILSLCGSADLSEEAGTLAYRFGRKGAVELTHPDGASRPQDAFRWGVVGAAGGDFIRFQRGDVTYTILYTDGPRLRYFAGLEVDRGAKRLATIACRGYPLGPDAFLHLYRAKLPGDHYFRD